MKWKALLGALCIILIGSTAHAEVGTYIVQFNNKVQLFETDSNERHESRNYTTATYEELQEYIDAGIVEYWEPDYEVELLETFQADNSVNTQWNLDAIKITKPWNIGCYGNDVVVGVIDSGCYAHPDLANNLLAGRNYTSSDIENTGDNIGHGTYVSGIIAAESNGEYTDGVSHKAKIVPLKCFDKGASTTVSMISDAIYDAVDLYDCDVINLSFGIPKSIITKTLELAIQYAIKNNCIVVAAVGNDGASTEYYPAKYDDVIGVGSIDEGGEISSFSQHNSTVDCVAPGRGINSVSIDGYSGNSGTSFAAPHVAAMAAIAKCIDENITAQEFTEILINTSHHPDDKEDLEKQYDVYYGYGIVDCEKMFDELLKGIDTFLSPISVVDGSLNAVIYNNSCEDVIPFGIVANYKDKKLEFSSIVDLNVPAGEYRNIQCELPEEKTKIMIWSGLATLTPLAPYREFIK
ncbi:MAG: S8 family serine peptidase [Clostridia bacterium]|nr:S8 family serine peptidase [Clostridia bacterium]